MAIDLGSRLQNGVTLPFSWFSDPQVFRAEQERIFAGTWIYAGVTDWVAEPGQFFTCRAGLVPIVVVRDHDGSINGFVNICRHRATEVAEGRGKRESLQCPYHAWTYGLDGCLRAAPRSEREPGFDRAEYGLLPVRVETWGPLVFVNRDLDAPPLGDVLGRLPGIVAEGGISFDRLRFRERQEWTIEANWKAVAENYLECYHCPTAHPGFSAVMDVSVDSYLLETNGGRMTQHGPPRPEPRGAYDPTGEVERGQFHLLFPGTVINVMPGRPNFSIGPIVPSAPETTYRFLDYFVAADADEAWIEESLAFDAQVGAEDRVLIERVQAGMRAGLIEDGRLLPESEQLIAHFQALVVDALA